MPDPEEYRTFEFDRLLSKVERFRTYRQTVARLARLEKAIHGFVQSNDNLPFRAEQLLFERQYLRQVVLWINMMQVQKESKTYQVCPQLQQLELIVHAHEVRMCIASSASGPFPQEQVARAMGVRKSEKVAPRRKKQLTEKDKRNGQLDRGINDIIVDQTLRELCMMDEVSFRRAAARAVKDGILFMRKKDSEKPKRSRKTKKKVISTASANLSKKMGRSKDPWKRGLRVVEEEDRREERVRWKGKARVKSRRILRWKMTMLSKLT